MKSRTFKNPNPLARPVTGRAVAVGLISAGFLCAVTPYNDFKIAATYLAGNQFPVGAIFLLLLLALVLNPFLRKVRPSAVFSPSEMLTVWTLILVASGLPSSGLMRYFVPHIVAPAYYSDDKNQWEAKVWADSPSWLKLTDKPAADAFFRGYPHGEERIPWAAWGTPLFSWGLLALFFLMASFCMASLLRRQWIENEKFVFPLVALPLLIAAAPKDNRLFPELFYQPLLWIGVAAVTVLHTIKDLHLLYPTVPDITTMVNLGDYLIVRPWDQLGRTELWFFPLVVGLTFLLPREVSFSIWFFYLFYKAELLFGAVRNFDMPGGLASFSYTQFHGLEAFGGSLALTAWTAWTARGHLRRVWKKAMGGSAAEQINDDNEMLSYRATLIGLAAAYGGMALWLRFAGVPVPLILLTLLLVTILFVVVSWMVCQAGMLFTQTAYGSLDILAPTVGTADLPIPALYTVARFENIFIYDTREMLTPSLLNSAKCAEAGQIDARSLFRAMVAAVGMGVVVSAVASLWLPYYNGGANSLQNTFMYAASPQRPLRFLGGAASVPYVGSWISSLHILGGFIGVFSLLALRGFCGWGLHPIGFLGASVSAARTLWFSIFVGWVCKSLIQRYGGMRGFTTLLPFFLGLVVGDVLNAVLWIAIGYLTGTGYKILPG